MKNSIQPRRSFIFTPALKMEMFNKAIKTGVDIVCVELEDGVSPKDKDLARDNAIEIFKNAPFNDGIEKIIRINSLRESFGISDIKAILASKSPPSGIMLPKVNSAEEVILLDNLLTERGHNCCLHIIIETNKGLELAFEIANCSKRIKALFFGGVDMTADLRCSGSWESLLYARSRVVHAAASAGIDAIDVPYLDLDNLHDLEVEAKKAKDLGFCGKGSIHPKQIPIINKVFTPSHHEIVKAQEIISAFEKADTGLLIINGKLIEKPVLREMYRLVSLSKKL